MRIAAALVLAGMFSCGGSNPAPPVTTVTPSTTLAPVPEMPPLQALNGRFAVNGAPINLIEIGWCCGEDAWPFFKLGGGAAQLQAQSLTTEQEVQRGHDAGANAIHIRLGPYSRTLVAPKYQPWLALPNGQYDYTKENPAFWAGVHSVLDLTQKLNTYAEVDVLDMWAAKHARDNQKAFGFPAGCEIGLKAPQGQQVDWINKVVDETGKYKQVFYQLGNESFLCQPSVTPEYEIGEAKLIRAREDLRGYIHHLIGSNSENGIICRNPLVGYVTWHRQASEPQAHLSAPLWNRPSLVNEVNRMTVQQFATEARAAKKAHTYYALWRDGLSDADMNRALAEIAKINAEP